MASFTVGQMDQLLAGSQVSMQKGLLHQKEKVVYFVTSMVVDNYMSGVMMDLGSVLQTSAVF